MDRPQAVIHLSAEGHGCSHLSATVNKATPTWTEKPAGEANNPLVIGTVNPYVYILSLIYELSQEGNDTLWIFKSTFCTWAKAGQQRAEN